MPNGIDGEEMMEWVGVDEIVDEALAEVDRNDGSTMGAANEY